MRHFYGMTYRQLSARILSEWPTIRPELPGATSVIKPFHEQVNPLGFVDDLTFALYSLIFSQTRGANVSSTSGSARAMILAILDL